MKYLLILFFIALLAVFVSAELCSDGEQRSCGDTNVGECKLGTQICINSEWGLCQGAIYFSNEICFDNKDNNCNGIIDENCQCKNGNQRICGEFDKGVCKKGTQNCNNNQWGDCEGEVKPAVSDFCNDNLDNDCDGIVDNNCNKASCFDKIQNQGETEIDCGGPCPVCKIDGCSNKLKDGDETGIDCGGKCKACETCFDGIQNQNEEDIDCGGNCPSCKKEEPIVEPVVEPIIEEPKGNGPLISVGVAILALFSLLYWYFMFNKNKNVKKSEGKQDKYNIFSEKVELKDVKSKFGKTKTDEALDKLFKKR